MIIHILIVFRDIVALLLFIAVFLFLCLLAFGGG